MKKVVTAVTHGKMQEFHSGSCNFAWLLVNYSSVTCWFLVHAAFYAAFHEVYN